MAPIKRDEHLQYLSRQHHQILIFCWKIRTALSRPGTLPSLQQFCLHFFRHYLLPHFQTEETVVYPVLGNHHPFIQQALAEHQTIQQLFSELATGPDTYHQLEVLLNDHIRYEERVLFHEIQAVATPEQLAAIAAADNGSDKGYASIEKWEDSFWE